MPFYEFTCGSCDVTVQERRSFDAMNEPGPAHCGQPTERIFSPTSNIHIPRAFGTTWSDIHDETEREIARNHPEWEPANRVASRPDGKAAQAKKDREDLEATFVDTYQKTEVVFDRKGWSKEDA